MTIQVSFRAMLYRKLLFNNTGHLYDEELIRNLCNYEGAPRRGKPLGRPGRAAQAKESSKQEPKHSHTHKGDLENGRGLVAVRLVFQNGLF